MPKRNDGNNQDLRIRPSSDAPNLEKDSPMTGEIPEHKDRCVDGYGEQVDLPKEENGCGTKRERTCVITTPSSEIEYPWPDLSWICPRGFDNSVLNALFITLLRNHFSNPDCIFYEAVKEYTWDPDPSESKIRIVMNTTFDPAQEEQMPSLIVKRGPQKPQRAVMGDRGERAQWLQGEERYTRFYNGSHRILATGYGDGFVEDLAQEVNDFFNAVSPVMRIDYPFHDFQVGPMTEEGIMEDLGNRYAVAIEVVYSYEYSWTIERRVADFARSSVQQNTELLRVEGP